MTIEELQGWVRSNWEQRSHHQPSIELQLLYILEELGEVAEAIRKIGGLKSRAHNEVDLGSEFADLIISITTLANHFNIQLDVEIEGFKSRLAERQNKGY